MFVNYWVFYYGFIVGIADIIADDEIMFFINNIIIKVKVDVKEVIKFV